jgi:hypothetical protein
VICIAFIYGFSFVWWFMFMPTGMGTPLIPDTPALDQHGQPIMVYKNQTRGIDIFSNGTHAKLDHSLRAKSGPIYENYGKQTTEGGHPKLPYDFRCPDGIYPCALTYSYDYQVG